MYLGIDFLIDRELRPFVVEVNVGLPGGAQEYDRTCLVQSGKPSDIFQRIEETSLRVYGRPFREYLHSLPFVESLKPFKIWMDGKGRLPSFLHPGLRLEDKWIQYQLLGPIVQMPETMVFDRTDLAGAQEFLLRKDRVILKRRVGRGGRGFQIITDQDTLGNLDFESGEEGLLLQEHIASKTDGYTFSVRSVAFGGEFMCMYANLARRSFSNHGLLTSVSAGDRFGLTAKEFGTEFFNQKSWEGEIWFGKDEPSYLKHNLYEDEVARTTLQLPETLYRAIRELSIMIERFYEGLDLSTLPHGCFESC